MDKIKGMEKTGKIVATIENRHDLVALANAGAQEVCVALNGFSVTALHAFTIEEMPFLVDCAKEFHMGVSVLMNALFHEQDLPFLEKVLATLRTLDITGIYFADLAVISVARRLQMISKLIYMPDTMMTSSEDALFYLNEGLQAVSVSALLTKEETLEIVRKAGKVVVPVYGHMVMSFSYRPLLSAWKNEFGFREEVRDRTDLYLVEEKRTGHMPVYEGEGGTLIYSDYVLDSFEILPEFMKEETPVYFMTGVFVERLAYIEAVHIMRCILDGEDAGEKAEEYKRKFADLPLSEGYYNEKTVR